MNLKQLKLQWQARRLQIYRMKPGRASFTEIGNRKLINPLAVFGNENRQFFHHELGFPKRADHVRASRAIPFLRHALAGMAAPTFDVGITREIAPPDLAQLVLVQPRFTCAVDVIAIIEHETGPIRVSEIFKIGNLYLVSRLAMIQIIDHLRARVKPDEVKIESFADRIDQANQVLVFLFRAVNISLLVNKPGDLRVRSEFGA